MRFILRGLLVLLLLVAVTGGAGWLLRDQIAMVIYRRGVDAVLRADLTTSLPDGLHVGLCGSGSPMPAPDRMGPCVAVLAGKRMFLVDSGSGGVRNLQRMGFSPGKLEGVFLTHFHSDHIDGLGETMLQRWATGSTTTPLAVFGPTGVDQVVAGFNMAYGFDKGYRIAHHGPAVVPPSGFGGEAHPFAPPVAGQFATVIDGPELKVEAILVDHHPVEPAVGYRFSYKGRCAVISGDTRPTPAIELAAKGCDLLVHEALAPNMVAVQQASAEANGRPNLAKIMHDIPDYHTTPEQAAGIAARAGVGFLLLDHIVPPLPLRILEGPFLGKARTIYKGPLHVGQDGDLVSMPVGSKVTTFRNLLH